MAESAARRVRVLGGLAADSLNDLIAEVVAGPDAGARVVLGPPGDPEVHAAVRRTASPILVAPREVLDTDRGRWAVVPWVPGLDLVTLREHHPDGVPLDVAIAILLPVVRGLRRLAAEGLGHGAMGPSKVRIGGDGQVRVVGIRGGRPPADGPALRDLLEELLGLDEGLSAPEAARPLLEDWVDDPVALEAHLEAHHRPLDLAGVVRPILESTDPALHPHPLAGAELQARAAGDQVPSKVRLAAVSAVTLALGLASGVYVSGTLLAPATPVVEVPGATEVVVDCDPFEHGGARLDLTAATTCRVTARDADGRERVGRLDGSLTGRYLCEPDGGELRCTER